MIIYPTWTQHLNKFPYAVVHAEYYMPTVPKAFTEGIVDENTEDWFPEGPETVDPMTQSVGFGVSHRHIPVAPFYNPVTPDHTVYAKVPISYIIDMWEKEVPCGIISPLDIVQIFHVLDAYLVENFSLALSNPKVLEDCHRTLAFRMMFYKKCFRRAVLSYPDWRDKYIGESDQQLEMFSIMSLFDPRAGMVMDDLSALAIAPVKLPDVPKDARSEMALNATDGFPTEYQAMTPEQLSRVPQEHVISSAAYYNTPIQEGPRTPIGGNPIRPSLNPDDVYG